MERIAKTRKKREGPSSDRPRERLLRLGAQALTDAELLALMIGSGASGDSALGLARRILEDTGGHFRTLASLSPEGLQQFRGVGPARAVNIAAALEIGRRLALGPDNRKGPVRQSADAFALVKPFISWLPHEEFWVLYLNNANRVLHSWQHSKGGITGTLVDVRLILKRALELGAVAIILAHNHPSGKLGPSKADMSLTRKVVKAAATMDIRVLDHLICSGSEYFSFADEQMI